MAFYYLVCIQNSFMQIEIGNKEIDGLHYEFFVRRGFGCERGARRYPYADSRAWTSLLIRRDWAAEGNATKIKEYNKYFTMMVTNFEKTIDYVIKKYSAVKKYDGLVNEFKQLKDQLSEASTLEKLMKIANEGLAAYDQHGIEKA